MVEFGSGVMLVLIGLGIWLAICWLVLPFAVIGLKPLVRDACELLRLNLETQRAILAELKRQDGDVASPLVATDDPPPAPRAGPPA